MDYYIIKGSYVKWDIEYKTGLGTEAEESDIIDMSVELVSGGSGSSELGSTIQLRKGTLIHDPGSLRIFQGWVT